MPDITMCMNEGCPRKKKCYRYKAIPSLPVQSYFMPDHVECIYFMEIDCRPLKVYEYKMKRGK